MKLSATKAPGGEGTPPRKVVDVRDRAALLRCATGGRERCERSGAEERPLPWRAGPVDLIQPRRASRTLLLAILVSLSRARVLSFAYVP